MTSNFKLYIALFSTLALLLWNCSSDSSDDGPGNNNPVSNLVITIDVVGADASNPNGDGSGVVNVTATATNAVNYGF